MARMGPKLTPTQRAAKKVEAERLDAAGWYQTDIAAKLGVSQPLISQWLSKMRADYRKEIIDNRQDAIMNKLIQYRHDLREVMEAWERSKSNQEKVVSKEVPVENCAVCSGTGKIKARLVRGATVPASVCNACNGKGKIGGVVEITRTTEGRLPDPAYYNILLKIREAERELLGLDAPVQTVNKNENVNIDLWNVSVDLSSSQEQVTGKAEAKLVEMLDESTKSDKAKKLGIADSGNGEQTNGHKENGNV